VLGAYLFAQLEQRTSILDRRRRVFDRYRAALEPVAHRLGLTLPVVPADREQAYHMFFVLLPDVAVRNQVLSAMREADIHATFHYVPLHSSPHGRRVAAREVPCPVTDDISGRLLRLPFYTGLTTTACSTPSWGRWGRSERSARSSQVGVLHHERGAAPVDFLVADEVPLRVSGFELAERGAFARDVGG
jgi:hypothetical protein